MDQEKLNVTLEQEEPKPKKPSFFKRHKDKIVPALCAAGGAVVTFVILAICGKEGKDTLACAAEDWETRKAFESSVDGTFDGSGLS